MSAHPVKQGESGAAEEANVKMIAAQLKEVVGLDDKNAADLARKPDRAHSVLDFFAALHADADTPREQKVMLFSLWTKVKSPKHRDVVAQLVQSKELQSMAQVDAAVKLLRGLDNDDAEVDVAALKTECGVGVYVSEEEVSKLVAAALAAENPVALRDAWSKNTNMVLGKMRHIAALRWAEVAHIKRALEAQVPPIVATVATAAAVATGVEEKKPAASAAAKETKVCPRHDDHRAIAQGKPRTRIGTLLADYRDGDVVYLVGWAHRVRHQSRMSFVVLRDGSGYVQCVLDGYTIPFHRETSLAVRGRIHHEPKAQSDVQPPLEIHVDEYAIIGPSDGTIETIVTAESSVDKLMDQRHVVLRGTQATAVMKVRHELLRAFREYFWSQNYYEVTPPTLVQTQCEGGSTIFDVLYYDEKAYLTQSSQLYLETVTASLGNVYCCLPSYRAEKSKTRRHLSEFTHLEVEYDVCTFEDMLNSLEDIICDVVHTTIKRAGHLIALLNPDQLIDAQGALNDPNNYKLAPHKPFMRMRYADAITYCNEHGIINSETNKPFEYGEDITEKPEREMVASIGRFVFLTHFPTVMKSFYMQRDPNDSTLTESVDVLAPGVGEIVGGSMRMWHYDELLEAFQQKGIDPTNYYWYMDQRKYGGAPHGGFGLGVERLLMWLCDLDSVKDACQYSRYMGRCMP